MLALLGVFLLIISAIFRVSDGVRPLPPVLLMVDGFSSYLSGYCKTYCEARGIFVKDIVSPYICAAFQSQGRSVPEHLRAPSAGCELDWSNNNSLEDVSTMFCLSESESGTTTAERLQIALRLPGNGPSPQLRNKYLANKKARAAGLPVVEQEVAKTWLEAKSFISDLWSRQRARSSAAGDATQSLKCILKPCRGVASDGVYCCESLEQAEAAFKALLGKAQYGGGTNDAVLVQEYADGPEYAVDTVVSSTY